MTGCDAAAMRRDSLPCIAYIPDAARYPPLISGDQPHLTDRAGRIAVE